MRVNYKWLLVSLAAIVLIGATTVTYKQNQVKEANLNNEIQQLKEQSKARSEADKQKLQKRELELQQQVRELNEKLQSKAAEKARIAAETAQKAAQASLAQKVVNSAIPTAHAATGDAKAFIYMKESGNNPGAINRASGACGLGQALPCSKMPCSLSDYVCQDQFFTQYMLSRYGTWENAQAFWLSHNWW